MNTKQGLFWLKIAAFAFFLHANVAYAINLNEFFPGLKPDIDGRIETLNNKGGMAPQATGAEIWLLADLKTQYNENTRLLEIGPAFGRMPVELFSNDFQGNYTAIDLSTEHLDYLRKSLQKFPEAKDSIKLITGEFPQASKQLAAGSFDIILATHVFHFFTPKQFDAAVDELWRLLAPGGKVYITVKTPYSQRYNKFIPVYLERKRKSAAHPGYIDNVGYWVDPTTIAPERLQKLYGLHLYFFGKEDLKKIFVQHKFKIARCEEVALGYESPIWQAPKAYADREDAVILAIKPKKNG
mgnify:CR=1 FL=1